MDHWECPSSGRGVHGSMSARIVIAGAGGFGREIHGWLDASPHFLELNSISEIVFIDDSNPEVPVDAPIVSTIVDFAPRASDLVICAIGDPSARRTVVDLLEGRGAIFVTFVDDRAVLGANVTLGSGTLICPGVVVTSNVNFGRHVHVNINCSIGHDVNVRDYVTLSPSCNLMGGVSVSEHAFIGTAVTILPKKSVGERALVGAGSVVVKDIPPDVTSFGNPSVTIRRNSN